MDAEHASLNRKWKSRLVVGSLKPLIPLFWKAIAL